MTHLLSQQQRWAVVLLDSASNVVAHLTTDNDDFGPIATLDRDRVFLLAGQDDDGAIYSEVPVWRIRAATADRPQPRHRTTPAMLHFQGGTA